MNARRVPVLCVWGLVAVAGLFAATARADELVEKAKVDALVQPLVDAGWIDGVAIGFISEDGTQQLGYGRISETNDAAPGPDTLFEIGSITKVFTGTILGKMVVDGVVKLDDPVQPIFGTAMLIPKGERPITLVDLATHTSGLPRMPTNFSPADPMNPYADYTTLQMGQFLAGHKLRREPGEKSEYSNLGMGLLGQALAVKNGYDYESLVEKEIWGPLEMTDTRITLDDDDRRRLAQGHDFDGNPVKNWDLPAMAGAGAIRSTTGDMLKFLAANLGLKKTDLDEAMALAQQQHFESPDQAANDVGLAWQLQRKGNVIWHNGGTGGYHTYAAIQPEKKIGVVVLASTQTGKVDELGRKLLALLAGEDVEPVKVPATIELKPEDLEPLVGRYQIPGLANADVTRDGDRLFLQISGQPKIGIYPTSETHFYCRPVEASFDFESDDAGKIARMVIHQGGRDISAKRVEPKEEAPAESASDAPAEPTEN
ncbi:MAG: serine hydrolase [Planctomycetota bacterium]|nr:MAG: serine hydrolase [Planctomycetota bacterium]